jgi:hypothetical protein
MGSLKTFEERMLQGHPLCDSRQLSTHRRAGTETGPYSMQARL